MSWDNYFSPYAINSSVQYIVDYNPACSPCFSFFANGSSLTVSWQNWTPTDAQDFAESHDQASLFPGGYQNPAESDTISVYYDAGGGGSWVGMAGETATSTSSGTVPSWLNVSPAPGTSGQTWYQAWDSACAS